MIPNAYCHCDRHLAIITAPDSLWRMWHEESEDGNRYWLDMAYEFCQPCWDAQCDTEQGVCP